MGVSRPARTKIAKRVGKRTTMPGRMPHLLLLCAFLMGSAALAADPSPPPVLPTEEAEPSLPPEFLDQALKVDGKNQVTRGRAQAPLTHRQMFELMGRTDLLAQSDALVERRKWLIVGAVALGAAGIATGIALIATAPNLASPACESSVRIYNEVCVPNARTHNISGTAVLVGGVVGAILMAGFAYGSDPAVLDRDQTAALIGSFNSQLARALRRPPAGLRLIPVVGPDGATLTASLRF